MQIGYHIGIWSLFYWDRLPDRYQWCILVIREAPNLEDVNSIPDCCHGVDADTTLYKLGRSRWLAVSQINSLPLHHYV
jgi:hypothetical protein